MNTSDPADVMYDLPKYSPVAETPKYTAEPRPDERRLQINRRVRREESGIFVEKTKHMTIALTNQVPDCKVPTYSRAAVVQGAITFVKASNLGRVEVKLSGTINISLASAVISGERDIEVCDETELLYCKDFNSNENESKRGNRFSSRNATPSSSSPVNLSPPKFSGEQCPATLVFTLQFPHTYLYEGTARMLPPSYCAQFGTIPGISLNIVYVLKIITLRKTSFGDKRQTTCVSLEYIPRSRPTQPSLPFSMTFLSTLKLSPEEWDLHEKQAQLKEGVSGEHPRFHFALAIPKSRIFPLTQPISFHLQLLSLSEELLVPFESAVVPPSTSGKSRKSKNETSSPNERLSTQLLSLHVPTNPWNSIASTTRTKARIIVSIERSVATETHGDWVTIKQTLTTQQLQPSLDITPLPLDKSSQMKCLAWDGQLLFKEEYHCSAFSGPGFRIRDFLSLAIYPPDPETSPLRPIFYSIPIRVSTDPYTDEIIAGMELIQTAPPMNDRS